MRKYYRRPDVIEKAKALVRNRYRRLMDTDPEWRERERKRSSGRTRKYYPHDPRKRRANNMVSRAVKNGTLARPSACTSCDKESDSIEGHHRDYEKPLEVIWLCSACHGLEHRGGYG